MSDQYTYDAGNPIDHAPQRPSNIVYFHSHDTGRSIQPLGAAVQTPAFQRVADEGLAFRDCHCAGPTCSPSRAALLTGMWPHQAGMIGLAHRGFNLADPSWHLSHYLAQHGYHTILAGLQHEASDKHTLGYAEHAYDGRWNDPHTTECAVSILEREAAAAHTNATQRPFFLTLGYNATHRGGAHAEDFWGDGEMPDPDTILPQPPLPDTADVREDLARFQRSLGFLDRQLGIICDTLDRTGLSESTLLVVTTDHGIPFPQMKCNLTRHGTGVLLLLRQPKRIPAGHTEHALVSQVDLFPTLCRSAGVPVPDRCVGTDLWPLIDREVTSVRSETHAEVTYHAAYEPQRMIRTQRWCYIRRFDVRTQRVLSNCDESPTKRTFLGTGWGDDQLPEESLFDCHRDAAEVLNVANDTRYAATLETMRERLKQWMEDTADPLLNGPVPPPPGVELTPQDSPSPAVGVYRA